MCLPAAGEKGSNIQEADAVNHSHGPGGDHSHNGVAFTRWLDLDQAAQQAEAISAALTRKRPDLKDRFDRNLQELKGDLLALDKRMAEIAKSDPDRRYLASHPVYQYLARRDGLNAQSLTWEPNEAPSEDQWTALEGVLRDHPAKRMLWEREPAKGIGER